MNIAKFFLYLTYFLSLVFSFAIGYYIDDLGHSHLMHNQTYYLTPNISRISIVSVLHQKDVQYLVNDTTGWVMTKWIGECTEFVIQSVALCVYNFMVLWLHCFMVSWSSRMHCAGFWSVLRNMKFSKFLSLEIDCDAQPSILFLWKYLFTD